MAGYASPPAVAARARLAATRSARRAAQCCLTAAAFAGPGNRRAGTTAPVRLPPWPGITPRSTPGLVRHRVHAHRGAESAAARGGRGTRPQRASYSSSTDVPDLSGRSTGSGARPTDGPTLQRYARPVPSAAVGGPCCACFARAPRVRLVLSLAAVRRRRATGACGRHMRRRRRPPATGLRRRRGRPADCGRCRSVHPLAAVPGLPPRRSRTHCAVLRRVRRPSRAAAAARGALAGRSGGAA